MGPGVRVTLRQRGREEIIAEGALDRLGPRLEARALGREDPRARAAGMVRVAWVPLSGPGRAALPLGTALEAVVELPPRSVPACVAREAVAIVDGRATLRVPHGVYVEERAVELGDADQHKVEVRGAPPGTEVLRRAE